MRTRKEWRPFPADYTDKMADDSRSLHIVDLNLGNKSVTNDVEGVLKELKLKHDLRGVKITYLDSMGCVDRIVHDNGKFIRFEPIAGLPE